MEACKACVREDSQSGKGGNYGVLLVPEDHGELTLSGVSLEKAQAFAESFGDTYGVRARVVVTEPGEEANSDREPVLFDVAIGRYAELSKVCQRKLPLHDAINFAATYNRMQVEGIDEELRAWVICREPSPAEELGVEIAEHAEDEDDEDDPEPLRHVIVYDLDEIPCAVFPLDNQGDWPDDEETVANYNKLALQSAPTGAHLAVIFDGPPPTLEDAQAAYEADDEDGVTNRWEVVQDLGDGHERILRSQVSEHVAKAYASAFEDYLKAAAGVVVHRKMRPMTKGQFCLINARWETDTPPATTLDIPEGDFEWDHDGDAMGDGLDDVFETREAALKACSRENSERLTSNGDGSMMGFGWLIVAERHKTDSHQALRSIDTRTGEGREINDQWTDLRLVRPTAEELERFGARGATAPAASEEVAHV